MKKISRNEYLLLFGRWTSKIGDIVFDYINNVVLVHAFVNSSWVLALYQSSQTIVSVSFNLIGGVVADLGKRKKILIISDLLSAFICFITSFFINSKFMAVVLIAANSILALIFSFSSPTFKSIVREMIEKDRIPYYNSISNGGKELISMVGPVIGLGLMNFIGAKGSLLINAVTFLASAVLECLLVRIDQKNRIETKIRKRTIIFNIKEGFQYLWHKKTLFHLLVISSFVNFFLAGYNLLIPYTNIIYQNIFKDFYSRVLVAQAIGSILGSFANSKCSGWVAKKYQVLHFFLGATGVSLVLLPILSLTKNLTLCLIPFALFGCMLTMFNINYMSYVQLSVDEEYLGRVFSVIFTISVIFMPIGSFVFSYFHITNNIKSFSLIGTSIILLTLCSFFYLKKSKDS